MGQVGTNLDQRQYMQDHDPHCPSCMEELGPCCRALICEEEERLDVIGWSIGRLDAWLKKAGAEPSSQKGIIQYRSVKNIFFGKLASSGEI